MHHFVHDGTDGKGFVVDGDEGRSRRNSGGGVEFILHCEVGPIDAYYHVFFFSVFNNHHN